MSNIWEDAAAAVGLSRFPSRLALRLSPASPTLSALFISALKDGPNVIRQVGRIDPLTCSRRSRTPRPASQFWTLLCTRSREEDHWEAVVFVQMSWCHGDSNDSDAQRWTSCVSSVITVTLLHTRRFHKVSGDFFSFRVNLCVYWLWRLIFC